MDLPLHIDEIIEERYGYELSSELSNLTQEEWLDLSTLLTRAQIDMKIK